MSPPEHKRVKRKPPPKQTEAGVAFPTTLGTDITHVFRIISPMHKLAKSILLSRAIDSESDAKERGRISHKSRDVRKTKAISNVMVKNNRTAKRLPFREAGDLNIFKCRIRNRTTAKR